jgi:hypothetical protein
MLFRPESMAPTFRGWKKALGMAAFLVACDPVIPTWGRCEVPVCSAVEYRLDLSGGLASATEDYYQIMWPGFSVRVSGDYRPQSLACRGGGRGMAYATSCMPCTGPGLTIDSLVISTDILLVTGDTLKAGHNFATGVDLPGLQGSGWDLLFDAENPVRFRDSVFSIRFTGYADSLPKTDTRTIIILNPDLLFP